jgi:hypothetical protein
MSKTSFHQTLLGRSISNGSGPLDNRTLAYYGLAGFAAEIVGAWIDGTAVKVLVRDGHGKTAEVWLTLFILSEGAKS